MKKTLTNARLAEDLVANYLLQQGWEIIARNWRRRGCELDVIAKKQALLTVVEVKYRDHFKFYAADLKGLLAPRKIDALRRGILRFLGEYNCSAIQSIRGDLALVTPHITMGDFAGDQALKITYYDNLVVF